MKKINILSQSGDIVSTFDVKELAEDSLHTQAIFDAVNTENQNKRQSTAHTKTKADVSGTGKKPYRQKHTGRARQGSRRNPQFVGGGTAFGPKNNRNYTVKMNKQVHKLAFNSAWAHIIEKEQISILDKAFFPIDAAPKTSKVFSFLSSIKFTNKKVLLVVGTEENSLFLSARNIPTIIVKKVNNLSVRDLLNQAHILVSNSAWDLISNKIK